MKGLSTICLVRRGCVCIGILLLFSFLMNLYNDISKEVKLVEIRPPISLTKEDLANGLPAIHRYLFNIHEISLLPARFDVVNPKSISRGKESNFNCTDSKSEPSFRICVYSSRQDKYISAALLKVGLWEPYITIAYQNALRRFPQATVIDVGANLGYYSLLAAASGHRVIALEPQKESLKRLAIGINLLKRGGQNVILLANALSDKHRNVTLSKNKDNQGGVRVLEECEEVGFLGFRLNPGGENERSKERCNIPTLTLDDLLYIMSSATAIIKIDIEGYECRAMAVSARFLSAINVPYIFMEWRQMKERQMRPDAACPSDEIRKMSALLADHGYVAHEIRSGIRLNPFSAHDWRVGDVYWRLQGMELLVPSL